jgi:gamma-glutamyl-gamma-aminobutyrate hydrolase PuuD
MRKAYIVGTNDQVRNLFARNDWTISDTIDSTDVVVFTGGADICPFLYGEKPLIEQSGRIVTRYDVDRDLEELKLYRKIPWDIPKIGICRGAQLLNVLAGGGLWQDVNHHAGGTHEIRYYTTTDRKQYTTLPVSSTHHQMMIPMDSADVIAAANESTLKRADGLERRTVNDEWDDAEIIYNWTNNSMCFQPHPEYGPNPCKELFFMLINKFFFSKQDKH